MLRAAEPPPVAGINSKDKIENAIQDYEDELTAIPVPKVNEEKI